MIRPCRVGCGLGVSELISSAGELTNQPLSLSAVVAGLEDAGES